MTGLEKMTEKESAHPTSQQLHDLTSTANNGELVGPLSPQVTSSPSSSSQDCPPLPMGTSIQPPAHPNTLAAIHDLKLSDKVRRHLVQCHWVALGTDGFEDCKELESEE